MNALFVLYDDACAFCCRCAEWLSKQPTFVPLAVLPASQVQLPLAASQKAELVVVDGAGGVYRDTDAWLMTLWALRDFRHWSVRLARGDRSLARKVVELAGTWRHWLSALSKVSDAELGQQLAKVPTPRCDDGACEVSACKSCAGPTRPGQGFCAKCLADALRS
ncbi:MAG: DUF393 domain-containing protein [Myxococcaceae bacterium]|nr:DUF393 domain-containing protein [Myxococcaceae bacterium]